MRFEFAQVILLFPIICRSTCKEMDSYVFKVLLIFCVARVTAQWSCRRHQHQSCVIDNILYIDGGMTYNGTSVGPGDNAQPSTLRFLPCVSY